MTIWLDQFLMGILIGSLLSAANAAPLKPREPAMTAATAVVFSLLRRISLSCFSDWSLGGLLLLICSHDWYHLLVHRHRRMIHPTRLLDIENICKFLIFVNVPKESVH